MGSYRLSRVEELLQREIANVLLNDMNDSRLKKVTLSHIKMSPDLRHARISFTVLDQKDIKPAQTALKKASHYLKKHIAKNLDLRVVPELLFVYDKALQEAEKLVSLISRLHDK